MLYFIRHGQTDNNLNKINCGGECNVPLNDTGIEQARKFGRDNKGLLETISHLYISPMIRTKQTAQNIFAEVGTSPEKDYVEGLREWHMGEWSGVHVEKLPDYWNDFDHAPPGGENFHDFSSRVMTALNDIAARHDEHALVVSHGGVWRAYSYAINHPRDFVDNCMHEELCRLSISKLKDRDISNLSR